MNAAERIEEISRNIELVREKIENAAARCGRKASDIDLMAVSKTKPVEDVIAAYDAGQRLFGENRINEAERKFAELPDDAELHMIGHLQRNKAAAAARCAACVQSIDKFSTAAELSRRAAAVGRSVDILIEINTSGELSKGGYAGPEQVRADLESYLGLPNIRLRGLMTMAAFTDDRDEIRRSFSALRSYFELLNAELDGAMDVLSMGMSSDYEIAVEEGSTLVRVGTAIFGSRNY